MTTEPHIVSSGGAVAWGKRYDPPQGAYAVWEVPISGWPGYAVVKAYPFTPAHIPPKGV